MTNQSTLDKLIEMRLTSVSYTHLNLLLLFVPYRKARGMEIIIK